MDASASIYGTLDIGAPISSQGAGAPIAVVLATRLHENARNRVGRLRMSVSDNYNNIRSQLAQVEANPSARLRKKDLDEYVGILNLVIKYRKQAGYLLFALSEVPPRYLDKYFDHVTRLFATAYFKSEFTDALVGAYCALSFLEEIAVIKKYYDIHEHVEEFVRLTRFNFPDRFVGFSTDLQYNEDGKDREVLEYLTRLQDVDLLKAKRNRRSRGALPDPTRSSDSEVNRLGTQFRARMSDEFFAEIESWIKANGLTKKEAAEYAFRLAMSRPYTPDGPS